jgi:hypothetical protein
MLEVIAIIISSLLEERPDRAKEQFWKTLRKEVRRYESMGGGLTMAVPLWENIEDYQFDHERIDVIDIALFFANNTAMWLSDHTLLSDQDREVMLQVAEDFGRMKL